VAAEVRVEHDRHLGVGHVRPPLEGRMVGVGDRPQQRADVERLLAARVGVLGEDVADRREVDPSTTCGVAHVAVDRDRSSGAAREALARAT
jgi:hypothetical protein